MEQIDVLVVFMPSVIAPALSKQNAISKRAASLLGSSKAHLLKQKWPFSIRQDSDAQ